MSTTIEYHPLTTVFTAPASCTEGLDTAGVTNGITGINRNRLDFSTGMSCYQFGYYDWYNSYSPGMCPSGYTTGYTSVLNQTITGARCCPTGLQAINGLGQPFSGCYSLYTTSTTVLMWNGAGSNTIGVAGPGIVTGLPYIVFYQSRDLSLFPKGYTPGTVIALTTSAGGTATVTTSSSANPTGTSERSGNTSSTAITATANTISDSVPFSTGAKVGIGVAIGLIIVAGAISAFWLVRRRRQRKLIQNVQASEWNGKPELEATGEKGKPITNKTSGSPKLPVEMGATVACYELPGSNPASPQLDSNPIYEFPAANLKL